MEGELWKGLYQAVMVMASRYRGRSGVHHPDQRIVLVLLWAALHDRPICWACEPGHWPPRWRHDLPSPATMSRRLRTVSVHLMLALVACGLRDQQPRGLVKCIDAKPLPVGAATKDRDAGKGRAAGGWAKGYKLHLVSQGPAIDAWRLGPMNHDERRAARTLIPQALDAYGGGYLLGDRLYDANPLYALAQQHGGQLLAPQHRPGRLGHRPQHPGRLRSLHLLTTAFGRALYRQRASIERVFGRMTNLGAGLSPLPNWVRRPHRVVVWVAAKLMIHTVWTLQHDDANTDAKC